MGTDDTDRLASDETRDRHGLATAPDALAVVTADRSPAEADSVDGPDVYGYVMGNGEPVQDSQAHPCSPASVPRAR